MSDLTADYKSPSSSHTFSLPTSEKPATLDVESKTKSLSTLRASLTSLQSDVNAFLTQQMEDDKAVAGSHAHGGRSDEERAEQMYGEEEAGDGD
nr:hypothetical protein CFP56_60279 [Quercus suber]